RNVGSLAIMDTIPRSNIFAIRTGSLWQLAYDSLGFLFWTRRNDIDTVIDFELFSRFTGLLTGLAGADRRICFHRLYGEGLYRGDMLTHRVAYNPHIHIAKNFIALVNALLNEPSSAAYGKALIDDSELALPVPALANPAHAVAKLKSLITRHDP